MSTIRKRKKRKVLRWCDRLVRFPNPELIKTDCTPRACRCAPAPAYNQGGFDWFDDGTGSPPAFDSTVIPDWALESAIVPSAYADCAADVLLDGGQPYATQPGFMSDACWDWWQSFVDAWATYGEDMWAGHYAGLETTEIPSPFNGTFISSSVIRIYGGTAGGRNCHCKNSTLHPDNPPGTATTCESGLPICDGCPTGATPGEFPPLDIVTI